MQIWIVDAFTDQPFKGNPAGVCLVKKFPSYQLMQNIASELKCSETAFVELSCDNSYHIKWFTPNSEAPLCGHATIAAAHIIYEINIQSPNKIITFTSLAGDLYVDKDGAWINLNFPIYEVTPLTLSKKLLKIVSLQPQFTGWSENCIIMEFENYKELITLKPRLDLLSVIECRALIATVIGNNVYDYMFRYFAPRVGINEDPVCASSNCRLIPYWGKKLDKTDMLAYSASLRGGIVKCKNLGNRVLISGKAVTIIEGKLNI